MHKARPMHSGYGTPRAAQEPPRGPQRNPGSVKGAQGALHWGGGGAEGERALFGNPGKGPRGGPWEWPKSKIRLFYNFFPALVPQGGPV